jgi:hypothetical protein
MSLDALFAAVAPGIPTARLIESERRMTSSMSPLAWAALIRSATAFIRRSKSSSSPPVTCVWAASSSFLAFASAGLT